MASEAEEKTLAEIRRKNRRFLANVGVISLSLVIVVFWCLNLPHMFQGSPVAESKPAEKATDFSQARSDLDRILQDTGKKFEDMKDQKEAQNLADTMNQYASSSLASSSLTTSSASLINKTATATDILKK